MLASRGRKALGSTLRTDYDPQKGLWYGADLWHGLFDP